MSAECTCDWCGDDAKDRFVIGDNDMFVCAECLPDARKQYADDNGQFGVGA